MASAAVFLDRDNTLIHNDGDLGDPAQVEIIQGVPSAIASLRGLGYRIIVVTNQGGVARGKYGEDDVEAVHQRINELIQTNSGARIDRFYYCPYHPEGSVDKYKREHPWRKPAPGMLMQAAKDMDIDLSKSWMIGDQSRDVQAGRAAGVRTVLLTPDAPHMTPLRLDEMQAASESDTGPARPTFAARSLIEATRIIAQQRKPELEDAQDKPANKRWNPAAVLAARSTRRREPDAPAPAAVESLPETPPPVAPTPQPHPPSPGQARPFRPWNAPAEATDDAIPTPPDDLPPAPAPAVTPATSAAADPAPSQEPAPPKPPVSGEINLLRQILHELRAQRGNDSDFAFTRMIAVVMQMIVVLCFVGAFWMSGDSGVMYLRWVTSAILIQLATIAMLLFSRR